MEQDPQDKDRKRVGELALADRTIRQPQRLEIRPVSAVEEARAKVFRAKLVKARGWEAVEWEAVDKAAKVAGVAGVDVVAEAGAEMAWATVQVKARCLAKCRSLRQIPLLTSLNGLKGL
nr:hypothetical protein [Desulfoluna sp.]